MTVSHQAAEFSLASQLPNLRKSYENAALDEAASQADPLQQFAQWLGEAIAAKIPEPNAMTLATVGSDMRPSTRVLLIKNFDARGIEWFTNYNSRKGQELAGNPYAALQFHWIELERVVRIEGVVERVDSVTSDAYFAMRPRLSQLSAVASPQSARVASRTELEECMDAAAQAFPAQVTRPMHWGGYRLVPDRFEFWQGRRNRLHDRLLYSKENGNWLRSRLAP